MSACNWHLSQMKYIERTKNTQWKMTNLVVLLIIADIVISKHFLIETEGENSISNHYLVETEGENIILLKRNNSSFSKRFSK